MGGPGPAVAWAIYCCQCGWDHQLLVVGFDEEGVEYMIHVGVEYMIHRICARML